MTSLLVAVLVAAPALAAGSAPAGVATPAPIFSVDASALVALVAGLGDEDPVVRARAAFVLGQIDEPEVRDTPASGLNDPDRAVRMWAGVSLASLGDERGLGGARAALVGTRWWVRYYAAVSLWRLGGERALAAIGRSVYDPDELVAEVAELALAGDLREWDRPAAQAPTLTGTDLTAVLEDAASLLVDEADAWFHMGDYRQSLRAQEAALFLDPELGWLCGVNGWLYWNLGRSTEALGAYGRWVHADPDNWEAHFGLGQHYFLTKRYDAAVEPLGRARELGCSPTMGHMHAHALEEAGRLDESLGVWRELAEEEPRSPIPPHHIQRLEGLTLP